MSTSWDFSDITTTELERQARTLRGQIRDAEIDGDDATAAAMQSEMDAIYDELNNRMDDW